MVEALKINFDFNLVKGYNNRALMNFTERFENGGFLIFSDGMDLH